MHYLNSLFPSYFQWRIPQSSSLEDSPLEGIPLVPHELQMNILSYLLPLELCTTACTCKLWTNQSLKTAIENSEMHQFINFLVDKIGGENARVELQNLLTKYNNVHSLSDLRDLDEQQQFSIDTLLRSFDEVEKDALFYNFRPDIPLYDQFACRNSMGYFQASIAWMCISKRFFRIELENFEELLVRGFPIDLSDLSDLFKVKLICEMTNSNAWTKENFERLLELVLKSNIIDSNILIEALYCNQPDFVIDYLYERCEIPSDQLNKILSDALSRRVDSRIVKFIIGKGAKPDSYSFKIALRSGFVYGYETEVFAALKNAGATINQDDLTKYLCFYKKDQRLEILQLVYQDPIELFTMALQHRCNFKKYLKLLVEPGVGLSDEYLRVAIRNKNYPAIRFLFQHCALNFSPEELKQIRYAMAEPFRLGLISLEEVK
jgi:hypothetical protein